MAAEQWMTYGRIGTSHIGAVDACQRLLVKARSILPQFELTQAGLSAATRPADRNEIVRPRRVVFIFDLGLIFEFLVKGHSGSKMLSELIQTEGIV